MVLPPPAPMPARWTATPSRPRATPQRLVELALAESAEQPTRVVCARVRFAAGPALCWEPLLEPMTVIVSGPRRGRDRRESVRSITPQAG